MSDPGDKITFRHQGSLVTAKIWIGNDEVGYERVDRSGGWHNMDEAKDGAIRLWRELQAEFDKAHPATAQPVDVVQPNQAVKQPKPVRPGRSTRNLVTVELAKYAKFHRLSETKNHRSALRWMWKMMKEKADYDPRDQKPKYFLAVRELMLDSKLSGRTVELYAKLIRESLVLIVPLGLDPVCIAQFENMPKKGDSEDSGGEPFARAHLRVILSCIATVSERMQTLVWIGLSGAPQIINAVFLPFSAIDWSTGLINYYRVKTGEQIKFYAMQPLMELLKKRRERLGPNAFYVFPELVFTKKEQKDSECNNLGWAYIRGWEGWKKVPKRTRDRGSGYGMVAIAKFLVGCGLKTDCGLPTDHLTFKSFRQHHISFWASLGIKLSVRMLIAGHTKKDNHGTSDIPTNDELEQVRNITWRYLQAIINDEEFFVPTCQYQNL